MAQPAWYGLQQLLWRWRNVTSVEAGGIGRVFGGLVMRSIIIRPTSLQRHGARR